MSKAGSVAFQFGLYCFRYVDVINSLFDPQIEPKELAEANTQAQIEIVKENLLQAFTYFKTIGVDPDIQEGNYERFFDPSSSTDETVVKFFRTLGYVGVTSGVDAEVENQENADLFARVATATKVALENAGDAVNGRQRINDWVKLRKKMVTVLRATAIAKGGDTQESLMEIGDSDILYIYAGDSSPSQTSDIEVRAFVDSAASLIWDYSEEGDSKVTPWTDIVSEVMTQRNLVNNDSRVSTQENQTKGSAPGQLEKDSVSLAQSFAAKPAERQFSARLFTQLRRLYAPVSPEAMKLQSHVLNLADCWNAMLSEDSYIKKINSRRREQATLDVENSHEQTRNKLLNAQHLLEILLENPAELQSQQGVQELRTVMQDLGLEPSTESTPSEWAEGVYSAVRQPIVPKEYNRQKERKAALGTVALCLNARQSVWMSVRGEIFETSCVDRAPSPSPLQSNEQSDMVLASSRISRDSTLRSSLRQAPTLTDSWQPKLRSVSFNSDLYYGPIPKKGELEEGKVSSEQPLAENRSLKDTSFTDAESVIR